MKASVLLFTLVFIFSSCKSQTEQSNPQEVGGPCEGCEALYEYGAKKLSSVDTLPKFEEESPKLKITGTVYKKDGKTPAEDVILYIYHTNTAGIYETTGTESGWGKRHGYIRGWIKTGKDGKYTFYTFRPGAYPNTQIPEHIHITVKEPKTNEYYIDSFVFEDDPFLTPSEKENLQNRGGSGIVEPKLINNIYTIERDLILGLNIPNYN